MAKFEFRASAGNHQIDGDHFGGNQEHSSYPPLHVLAAHMRETDLERNVVAHLYEAQHADHPHVRSVLEEKAEFARRLAASEQAIVEEYTKNY